MCDYRTDSDMLSAHTSFNFYLGEALHIIGSTSSPDLRAYNEMPVTSYVTHEHKKSDCPWLSSKVQL